MVRQLVRQLVRQRRWRQHGQWLSAAAVTAFALVLNAPAMAQNGNDGGAASGTNVTAEQMAAARQRFAASMGAVTAPPQAPKQAVPAAPPTIEQMRGEVRTRTYEELRGHTGQQVGAVRNYLSTERDFAAAGQAERAARTYVDWQETENMRRRTTAVNWAIEGVQRNNHAAAYWQREADASMARNVKIASQLTALDEQNYKLEQRQREDDWADAARATILFPVGIVNAVFNDSLGKNDRNSERFETAAKDREDLAGAMKGQMLANQGAAAQMRANSAGLLNASSEAIGENLAALRAANPPGTTKYANPVNPTSVEAANNAARRIANRHAQREAQENRSNE